MSHAREVLPRLGAGSFASRRALRCVIGMDGSEGEHTAAALASVLAWPEGSGVVFVTAVARLARLVLGSVSRRVLTGAVRSVLAINAGACCGLRQMADALGSRASARCAGAQTATA